MIKKGKYGRFLHIILTFGDFLLLNGLFALVVWLNPSLAENHLRVLWLLINVAYMPVAMWLAGVFKVRSVQMDHIVRTALLAIIVHGITFMAMLYAIQIDLSWDVMAEFYGGFVPLLIAWRVTARMVVKIYRTHGGNFANVVIVGCNPTAIRLFNAMNADSGFGYFVQGFFDDECPENFEYKNLYLGTLADLDEFVTRTRTREIFYALPGIDEEAMSHVIGVCDRRMSQFHYVPQLSHFMSRKLRHEQIGAIPLLGLMNNPLDSPINQALKRGFDIVFSGAFLLVSPLIFIPIALAIKLSSPGPVFFRQKRTGYLGNEFTCLKFRTMRVNANADKVQASKNDPRKTRLGDFLRRTSLDELPQFINVFLGDMSIVGPRPHMLKHTEDYSKLINKYMMRHLIKPGITGWAQVSGYRGQTEQLWQMEGRVEHDIWYIEHWSFLLDIKIVIRTVVNAIKKDENAF